MGRPIEKKFFSFREGDTPSSKDGFQFTVNAVLDTGVGVESCFIIEQKGTGRYDVKSASGPGDREGRVTLVDNNTPGLGEGYLEIEPYGGGPNEFVRVINQYQVKTHSNNTYVWRRDKAAWTPDATTDPDGKIGEAVYIPPIA